MDTLRPVPFILSLLPYLTSSNKLKMGACTSAKKKSRHVTFALTPGSRRTKVERKADLPVSYRTFLKAYSYNISNEYELLGVIGSGAFSKVLRAQHLPTGQLRAIKKIKKAGVKTSYKEYLNEISILRALDHPNIHS